MAEIMDLISDPVFPLFWHFSEKGIVPRIINAEPDVVMLEEAKGPRLGELIAKATRPTLLNLYTQLGTNTAYINKYCVAHHDLHTENVVVEGKKPIIIDWGKSIYLGISGIEFWKEQDSRMLLDTTRERLQHAKKEDLYDAVETAYRTAFEREFAVPQTITHHDIAMAATDKFGF